MTALARSSSPLIVTASAALALALAGCATPRPAAPTVMALPAKGESFEVFQQHDGNCRSYASTQTGQRSPGQAAAVSGASGAAVGAGVGAAAGALLGSASGQAGGGAALGAGIGLLSGGLLGSARGAQRAAAIQRSYDMSYTQCMIADGEQIAHPPPRRVVYAAPYYGGASYVPAPVYVQPVRVIPLPPPPPPP
ncbi:MAG TPA: glycine zipper family protein [Steroidobacteraceae bacterium]